ncbi:class II glutamine amidotransferase [Parafrankia colletiae]|uniref:Class II glutamine amidotransferase n=1 Tax=Parafrankia colletiae TaxID=573497 RepID=A0A1S1Q4B9_9ACTN|nr:class II glutamine amidotransferase [Parafrankia colletiae]
MCRWMGYRGEPIVPRVLLYDPERSLIAQSVRHGPDLLEPNGDGTGLGWYSRRRIPAIFRSDSPAWGDENFRELADEIYSPMFLAHVRAGTGTPVQKTNCHPFRYQKWLFVHNGYIDGFDLIRRDLLMAVRPDLFSNIKGSTDSEVMFHLALTFGLEEDPIGGLERMAGFVESTGTAAGVAEPLQMTVGLADGETLFAARYASGPVVNTLYMSEGVDAIRMLYPEHERLRRIPADARAVLSEPLSELPGVWREIPPSTALVVTDTPHQRPFHPQSPV